MKKEKLQLPSELQTFIDQGNTTFCCEDGEWDLRVAPRDASPFKKELPPKSIMIAENGCGDCLFLKTVSSGKIEPKVFVYRHEEERSEVFAKHIKELTATRPPSGNGAPSGSGPGMPVAELEAALAAGDDVGDEALARFQKGNFGIEALPVLRKILASGSITRILQAIKCIGKLGPEVLSSLAAQEKVTEDYFDLEAQLFNLGNKVWGYSGYPNCYSECLNTLLKLEVEEDYIIDYVRDHIGLGNPDDLLDSLNALKTIGTPEAISILKRGAAFWLPDLNMKYAKAVKNIVATARVQKR